MYGGKTVGVVVPAYNEEGFVGDVLDSLPDYVDRVYAVDDASTDDTWAEIREHAAVERPPRADSAHVGETADETPGGVTAPDDTTNDDTAPDDATTDADTTNDDTAPDDATTDADAVRADGDGGTVVGIRHERNRGAGGAIKTGYLAARDDGVDVTVTIDADGQMDPAMMTQFLDPIVAGDADYVKGDRLATPEFRDDMPRFRLVGNWLLTGLTRIASGYWTVSDPQNGYTAISLAALESVDLDSMYEYYGYCNDLLVKLNVAGMSVVDVPMPASYGDEESSIDYGGYIPKVSLMLLQNFLWRLRTRYRTHPAGLAYGLALLGAVAVLVRAALALGSSLAGGDAGTDRSEATPDEGTGSPVATRSAVDATDDADDPANPTDATTDAPNVTDDATNATDDVADATAGVADDTDAESGGRWVPLALVVAVVGLLVGVVLDRRNQP